MRTATTAIFCRLTCTIPRAVTIKMENKAQGSKSASEVVEADGGGVEVTDEAVPVGPMFRMRPCSPKHRRTANGPKHGRVAPGPDELKKKLLVND